MDKRNRLKSWALWAAIAALIVFCVKEFGGMDISEAVDGLLNVALPFYLLINLHHILF